MTTQTTSTILTSAIASSQELLTQFSLGEDLIADLSVAFGSDYDSDAAQELISQWQTGEFTAFPELEIRSAAEINGANGAYSADTNKIYISEEYLQANANDVRAVRDLILEEYGHFVDASINPVDSAGDEGAIFSGLVQGESFTESELQQLQLENDQAVITLDGQEIAIEQQFITVQTGLRPTILSEDFAIREDLTNVFVGDFDGDGKDDFLRQEKGNADNDEFNTAKVFFSNSSSSPNRTFHQDNRLSLSEDFNIKGDETNLYIGDFNGDGKDDFLRQEKGSLVNDNRNTAQVFFSNSSSSPNRTFHQNNRATLPENVNIRGDLTNVYVRDFNGDGRDDILRQEKGRFDDDNISTAQILFADSNGRFSTSNRITLPENFNIKGDLTDLYVGDFNGDGQADFISVAKNGTNDRIFFAEGEGNNITFNVQDLQDSDGNDTNLDSQNVRSIGVADINGDGKDDIFRHRFRDTSGAGDANTYDVFLSDGDRTLGASFSILGPSTNGAPNVVTGDFDGNGVSDFLQIGSSNNRSNDEITFLEGFRSFADSDGGSATGSAGNDSLFGRQGNDTLIGLAGNDSLDGGDGNDILNAGAGNDTLDGGDGNDILNAGAGNDTLDGGDGNDVLEGGQGADILGGGAGVDAVSYENSESGVVIDLATSTASGGDANGDAIADFESAIGSNFNDILTGDDSSNRLRGNNGADLLSGGAGDDILEGGVGDDILDGGDGADVAAYQGDIGDFEITINDDGSITVEDNNTSDGDEGTDTLTNISQLSFGGNTRLGLDNARNTVLGVADVSSDARGNSIFISGGQPDATNFIIDLKGNTGSTLDFNTQQLADFINTITLPDEDIEIARLSANLAFDAIGGAFDAIPVLGAVGSTATAIQQTLANYAFDLAQVEAQKEAAINAVRDFDSLDFGTIEEETRDIVVIEDFKIGVDNVFLPSISIDVNVAGFEISQGELRDQNGEFQGGAFIEVKNGQERSDLVFIANQYDTLEDSDFTDQISNLFQNSGSSGSILGTFNPKPVDIEPLQSGTSIKLGSFAGDHIFGRELGREQDNSESGTFEFVGQFGDDFIQGASQDDLLYGGFNSNRSLNDGALTYEDDGFDILQGGRGDDLLNGGSGNDTLDGGGLIYDDNLDVTDVIVSDGTDTLTGGSGNDTFVFNTPETGIDVITDFTVSVDKIQINADNFGTDISEFSFDQTSGALSFGGEQFAILENNSDLQNLQNFDVNRDIQLVSPSDIQLV